MSKKAQKTVCLQPTEEQSLRAQLLQMRCHQNLEAQAHMDALRLFWESQNNLFRLALYVAGTNKPYAEQELARLQEEGKQVLQELVNLGPQIVTENCWPDDTKFDPVALTFTVPDSSMVPTERKSSEPKTRIQ